MRFRVSTLTDACTGQSRVLGRALVLGFRGLVSQTRGIRGIEQDMKGRNENYNRGLSQFVVTLLTIATVVPVKV